MQAAEKWCENHQIEILATVIRRLEEHCDIVDCFLDFQDIKDEPRNMQ